MNQKVGIIKETSRGIERYSIEEDLLRERKIFLLEEVNPVSSAVLIQQLMYLEKESPEQEITLYINSPGGEVVSGMTVYDYMIGMSTPIRTVCIGYAASMGSILFLAGEKREMLPHTQVMIHDPYQTGGMDGRKPDEIEEQLNKLKRVRDIISKVIVERTGRSMEEVREKMKTDSYFDATEAIAFGLATGIVNRM